MENPNNKYRLSEKRIKNVIIGTGAAGYNAAIRLKQLGEEDTAIITENVNAGTSRNAGSDKQTYYKLSLAGSEGDSTLQMAEDLFSGQCVDGDTALIEAALSARSFYHLLEAGVPFPCNEYGEYMGYQTDHDVRKRATSAGPYTSKLMTEALQKEAKRQQVWVLDKMQAIKVLARDGHVRGVLCLDLSGTEVSYIVIWCKNLIFATGGPAGIYRDSVYPASQIGSSGIAFLAGVKGKNLTEWQYGMASVRPRWNVSGSYMQVLPCFISTDEHGNDEREFLTDYYEDKEKLLDDIFLKGYQWPFDVNKVFGGSSFIDILVYYESIIKGRRVFLDYRRNPFDRDIPFEKLDSMTADYLKSAKADFGTPIERLCALNMPAVSFYMDHGVNLSEEMLEIRICAQHNNGGLSVDENWETNIKGIFAAGEAAGTHGVTRPGGSALNAGQAGSLRAAEYIAKYQKADRKNNEDKSGQDEQTASIENQSEQSANIENSTAEKSLEKELLLEAIGFISLPEGAKGSRSVKEVWNEAASLMSANGAMLRNEAELRETYEKIADILLKPPYHVNATDKRELGAYYHLYDSLISQLTYLGAMLDYIARGKKSRGSALYSDKDGPKPDERLPDCFRFLRAENNNDKEVQEVMFTCRDENTNGQGVSDSDKLPSEDSSVESKRIAKIDAAWRMVRKLPKPDYFFETEWKKFIERNK